MAALRTDVALAQIEAAAAPCLVGGDQYLSCWDYALRTLGVPPARRQAVQTMAGASFGVMLEGEVEATAMLVL